MTPINAPALPPEIEFDSNNKELLDQVQAALLHPLSASFQRCIETLQRLAGNARGKARLYRDFAPLSFGFSVIRADGRAWIHGGLIFHGPHDGGGNGGAPTYSVSLEPTEGWSLHT